MAAHGKRKAVEFGISDVEESENATVHGVVTGLLPAKKVIRMTV